MVWLSALNGYTALVSGIFMLCMGFFVFFKSPTKKLNIVYLLFTASMANWLIVSFMLYNSKSEAEAIFWDRIVYLGVAFIPSSLFHLGLIFTDKEKTNKKWISLGYFFSFVFVFLSQTPYFIDGIYEYSWGVHSQARIFHHLFLLFFFSYSSLFVWNTYKYLKGASKENFVQVQQIKYFLVSFIILLSGSYAFLAAYNINFNPLGAYLLELLSVSILSFAITKYRLFETKALLTELLVISMAIVLFVLPFFMPTATLKIAAIIIFSLYSIVGYLLIKSTKKEVKAKEGLECVVKERTKELADRNEELEKWYKLTIGREVRMAELKEKIKEMEGKN